MTDALSNSPTARQQALGPLFAPLAAALREGRSTQEIYDAVVRAAVEIIDGCDHACVSVMNGSSFQTASASDDIARHIDSIERETGEGPCMDAILDEAFQYDADIEVDPTWPIFAKRCVDETPARSMLAFRMIVDDRKVGALDIFSDKPHALTERSIDQAGVLAAFAAVAAAGAGERHRADNLALALDSNREIGKAIGMLMAAHKLTDQQAFDVLKRTSQDLNRKLNEIAVEFVAKQSSEQ